MTDQKSKIKGLIVVALMLAGIFIFFRFSSMGTTVLWDLSDGGKWLLPLVAVAALIDSINPCAFSILLVTIAFLFSIGKLRSSIMRIGGAYIFGIFVVYILIGLGILQALHFFDVPHFMAKVGALFLVVLGGINLINEFLPAFPLKLKVPHVAHRKIAELMERSSMGMAFLLGAFVGLCEFPCTGGPYLMVLGLLHDQATYLRGLSYLIFYNLIFVAPLVVILFIASSESLLSKVQTWQKQERKDMRVWAGIAMILLGTLIFFL
ncbi:MAG TPA: cytochrome c biogenesis protein CcdA [Candidatus Paceibacterota bacterium]|nr:cytochrome c biogenesis protein CcdA [Candidatus Paceibacterota bacterium]